MKTWERETRQDTHHDLPPRRLPHAYLIAVMVRGNTAERIRIRAMEKGSESTTPSKAGQA